MRPTELEKNIFFSFRRTTNIARIMNKYQCEFCNAVGVRLYRECNQLNVTLRCLECMSDETRLRLLDPKVGWPVYTKKASMGQMHFTNLFRRYRGHTRLPTTRALDIYRCSISRKKTGSSGIRSPLHTMRSLRRRTNGSIDSSKSLERSRVGARRPRSDDVQIARQTEGRTPH